MATKPKILQVGLAIGRGTGSELGDVFVKVLCYLALRFNLQIRLRRSSRIYHSYNSLFSQGYDFRRVRDETNRDAEHYEEFCNDQAKQDTTVIFRTAFTAQSLYLVRQHLTAVKIEYFQKPSGDILLVRDQAQGFYTGSNHYALDSSTVSRTCDFSSTTFDRIITYALSRAHEHWGKHAELSLTLVYKHHLFDGVFDDWSREWSIKHGLPIRFVQPDTMNRDLLAIGVRGHNLIVASNEYADIMEAFFLHLFGQGTQETSFSENVYLAPQTNGLVEYQTVHGSADDLTGKGIVNPSAALKVAARILERHGHCKGVESEIDRTVNILKEQKICTPDQGGTTTTADYVVAVLENLEKLRDQSTAIVSPQPSLDSQRSQLNALRLDLPTLGLKTALLIVDFQKDLALRVNSSSPPISTIAHNISRLLLCIRNARSSLRSAMSPSSISDSSILGNIEIAHIRFFGDPSHQTASWAFRNLSFNRPTNCISGTEGADFIEPIEPQANEPIFDKFSIYDPFMAAGFESYIKEKGFQNLILAGLYGDVCIDTTARSAFQRGLCVSTVRGCVGNLHLSLSDWEKFAGNVYGARMLSLDELEGCDTPIHSSIPLSMEKQAKLA